jgi:hypothetical protein
MNTAFASARRTPPRVSPVLWKMYVSKQPLNEGLLSFEYPLFHATDEELDDFLGSIAKTVTKAGRVSRERPA